MDLQPHPPILSRPAHIVECDITHWADWEDVPRTVPSHQTACYEWFGLGMRLSNLYYLYSQTSHKQTSFRPHSSVCWEVNNVVCHLYQVIAKGRGLPVRSVHKQTSNCIPTSHQDILSLRVMTCFILMAYMFDEAPQGAWRGKQKCAGMNGFLILWQCSCHLN